MGTRMMVLIGGVLVASVVTAWAQFQGPHEASLTTVATAQEAADDSWVTLTGKILRQVSSERYLFQDATGTMIIEIDQEDWRQVRVNPETVIRISGEVDRDWTTTELEVEMVELVTES